MPETNTELPRYNAFFATIEEARLIWALYNMVLHGIDSEIPIFPGDKPQSKSHRATAGSGLFASLHEVDLAEYAARFTQLTPAGAGKWRGLCPLHQEKTPSFYVYSDPWRWRCYGACATGGDIVALARELRRKGAR